jgi:hypothetical protein
VELTPDSEVESPGFKELEILSFYSYRDMSGYCNDFRFKVKLKCLFLFKNTNNGELYDYDKIYFLLASPNFIADYNDILFKERGDFQG